jgi:DNA polymerase (family 10)
MTNLQIAELLRNVASSYQYKDEQKFKFQIIAYNRAADAVEHSTSELKDLWDDGKLDEVPSIGTSIASHLDELFRIGKSKHFNEVMSGIPRDAFILMVLPKVGIKTAIKMIEELPKSELKKKIIEADKIINKTKRHLLSYAEGIAASVVEWLKEVPEVIKIDSLGSLRRKVATVGDIDIAVATNNPSVVFERFVNYPKIQKVIEKGEHTGSILLPGDIQVDLLVTNPESYGSALQHFTGSKHHNIAFREYSLKKGFSMSEHGIKDLKNKKIIKLKTEEELYNHLGLKYIEPELREDTGEIEASKEHNLPKLLDLKDIKGDLQIHSDFDIETSHDLGVSSMENLVEKGRGLGYEYIAFTEHNPSKHSHSDKQVEDLLKRKKDAIDKINYSRENGSPFVLNSLEIDINKDGSLPVSVKSLEILDFALVSIHSSFDLPRDEMTKRVLVALSYPKVKIFAHPTGRKINVREGVELDWEKIFDFCKLNNKFLEINADPMRLDLPDNLVRDAVKLGVKLTLGTDTHEVAMMDNMKYGVYVARRGWCEKKDMLNCLSLKEFKEVINL